MASIFFITEGFILLHNKKKYEDINEYNIHINNLNGIFQVTASNLAIPFITIFAKRLNAADYQVALLSSLPAIISVGAIIPGALYIEKCSNKKNITGRFFIMARLFYLLFAAVPLINGHFRASLFVLLYGLMNLPGSISLAAWQSFIAGLFPPYMRAGALAKRNRLSTLFGTAVTLITGFLLYNVPRTDDQRLLLYQMFFILAFLLSCAEIYLFYKHKEMQNEEPPGKTAGSLTPCKHNDILTMLSSVKSNKIFINYCAIALLFHFAWYMSGPLFPLYEIDHLHSNEMWTSIISAVNALCSAYTYPYWSKLIEKKGNGLPLAVSSFIMGIIPLSYPHLHSLYALLPITALSGIALSGITLVILNTLYDVSSSDNRTIYIAVFNTLTNILLALAPMIGIWIKDYFGIATGFTISGMLRMLAGLLFFFLLRDKMGCPYIEEASVNKN